MGLFKSKKKEQIENRTPGSSYMFFTGTSSSGKVVTERSALQMTAVYSCVRILAEAVAGLPLHFMNIKMMDQNQKLLIPICIIYFTMNQIQK